MEPWVYLAKTVDATKQEELTIASLGVPISFAQLFDLDTLDAPDKN